MRNGLSVCLSLLCLTLTASAAVLTGNAKDWNAGKGSQIKADGGVMILTRGAKATAMLTKKLPVFSGAKATLTFRMKTPATGKGGIRMVSRADGKTAAERIEFDLGAPGEWNSYTVPIEAFDGEPVSLWIELLSAQEELQFSEISLESCGTELKRWSF